MNSKLILVEGLPGSGKTTTSKLVHQLLSEKGFEPKLFVEGDINHPADFESVACLSEIEYSEIKHQLLDESFIRKEGNDYLIPYRKLKDIPNELLEFLSKRDIYELPFEKNQELIVNNWGRFAQSAEGIYVFECCFIQNPVTVGMIKYGVSDEKICTYVEKLADKIRKLNPLVIYVSQDNLEFTFTKAVQERPKEWSQFFIDYYTSQGFGKAHGLEGLEGTLEVLKARKGLEEKIIQRLDIPKVVVNNSNYDLKEMTDILNAVL
jgi:energy-coupling factor transporter ATP-binding protein EcfA2